MFRENNVFFRVILRIGFALYAENSFSFELSKQIKSGSSKNGLVRKRVKRSAIQNTEFRIPNSCFNPKSKLDLTTARLRLFSSFLICVAGNQ